MLFYRKGGQEKLTELKSKAHLLFSYYRVGDPLKVQFLFCKVRDIFGLAGIYDSSPSHSTSNLSATLSALIYRCGYGYAYRHITDPTPSNYLLHQQLVQVSFLGKPAKTS